jgi:hypothetical protein
MAFRKNRFNIFKKCRQVGISKISGAFALWYAMFHNNKTILIISRTDEDAMGFLREQILFLFDNLPAWMVEMWKPIKRTDHELIFPNGSRIKSLTSHPDVMRSNSSSLNIIDEAAFIQNMDAMWAGGWPTLQHGGSCIVISTTNGVGGWYWSTMTDAETGTGPFNPVIINWWDMDWVIEYDDPISGRHMRIAPRDGLTQCDGRIIEDPEHGEIKLDPVKYGPYWSPWLETQYRGLQEKGEAWRFEQEILAQFVGSGNTVLSKTVLTHLQDTVADPMHVVKGSHTWVHPVTGEAEELPFFFKEKNEGLWIWKEPVLAIPEKRRGNQIIIPGAPGHNYVIGVDIASGRARDYSTIEVFDVDEQEQAAEFMARVLPSELVKYVDRISRYYNCGLLVIERNNGGDMVIEELRHKIMYPKLWRKKDINDKPTAPGKGKRKPRALKVGNYGFMTSQASKQILNKVLIDLVRDKEGLGYKIYSRRLLKQFNTYVRKRDRTGRDTMKTEAEDGSDNYDDLVMAAALALYASFDAISIDHANLTPIFGQSDYKAATGPLILSDTARVEMQQKFASVGGPALTMPVVMAPMELPEQGAQRFVDQFTLQLGAVPISNGKPLVQNPKYYYTKDK